MTRRLDLDAIRAGQPVTPETVLALVEQLDEVTAERDRWRNTVGILKHETADVSQALFDAGVETVPLSAGIAELVEAREEAAETIRSLDERVSDLARELQQARTQGTAYADPWTLARALGGLQGHLEAGDLPYDVEHTAEALLDQFTDLPKPWHEFESNLDPDEEPLPQADEWASPGLPCCVVCGDDLDAGTDGLYCSPECRAEWRADVVRAGETVPGSRGMWVDPDSMAALRRAAAEVAR